MMDDKEEKLRKNMKVEGKPPFYNARVFYIFIFGALALLALTWVVHNYVAEPGHTFLHHHFPKVFNFEKGILPDGPMAHAPKEHHKTASGVSAKSQDLTLKGLDKRLDRLEGLISEAGSFEQDIDVLKAGVQRLQDHVVVLEAEIKNRRAPMSADFLESVAAYAALKEQLAQIQQKLTALEAARDKAGEANMAAMQVIQTFNQVRAHLYAGAPWYFLLEDLQNTGNLLPPKALAILADLVKNLKPYAAQEILPPMALKQAFYMAVNEAANGSQPGAAADQKSGNYWEKIKSLVGRVVQVSRKNRPGPLPSSLSFTQEAAKAVDQQRVGLAAQILASQDQLPPSLGTWQDKARPWVEVTARLETGQEALLKSLLLVNNKG